MSANSAPTTLTHGIRSDAVKVLVSAAQALGWTVHRGAGVMLVSPDGKVKRQLPDNNSIRHSVFTQSLRALVTHSSKSGSPYLADDLIRTFKPDKQIAGELHRQFGEVQRPKEPKPVAAYRNDAPVKITETLTNDPAITKLLEEQLVKAEAAIVADLAEPWPWTQPYIVGEGSSASYTSESLVRLVNQDGSSCAACIICLEPMEPRKIGTHRRWRHPDAPALGGYVRKTDVPYRKKAKAKKPVVQKERFPRETPISIERLIEAMQGGIDEITTLVTDNANLREENGLLHAEIERLTADRKALRDLLS